MRYYLSFIGDIFYEGKKYNSVQPWLHIWTFLSFYVSCFYYHKFFMWLFKFKWQSFHKKVENVKLKRFSFFDVALAFKYSKDGLKKKVLQRCKKYSKYFVMFLFSSLQITSLVLSSCIWMTFGSKWKNKSFFCYSYGTKSNWSAISWFYLTCLGPEDNIAEYYQQQVEMLEGFNEMDALAERGFIPGMSKVLGLTNTPSLF